MSTEFVGIELKLMGADGVRRDLEQLDKLLNSFRGRKKFDAGFTEARQQVIAYKAELEKLRREQSQFKKNSDEWKSYSAAIQEAKDKLWNAQQAVREFGQASREAGRTFKETFNMISSRAAHIGSAMQSFGNAMTQLTSPFRRLTSGIVMGAGFKAMNSFTEGFEKGFTRYDTMKKYPKIMAAFGYSAEQAEESVKALDLSVRGLPTGLDEMVDLAQRFTATTGDIEKGTKLAIATNNAFLASMSTDTQKYQGMMQLQDVLGGKDMNSREWNSLVSSMTPAIVKMGESLGYTSDNMSEWIQKVRDGKVKNEDFIDTLIEIGNEGGVLEAMAQESKNTWQAFFANVGNASSRMTAGILKAFDEISQAVAGKDVNQLFADTIIPSIDKATESVKKWIRAHPAEITRFFQDLKRIKIGNFLKGYVRGLEIMIGLVEKLATTLGKHPKLMGFLGGFFGIGGILGKMSTIFGGLLKGTRHIWGGIGAGGSWLLKGKLGGIFGRIASIFGDKKSIQAAGDAAKTIPSVADTFKGAFSALQGVMVAAGAVTLVSGAGFVAFKSVKSMLKDLRDIGDILQGMTWLDAVHGTNIVVGLGVFVKIFSAFGEMLGPKGLLGVAIASAATALVSGSFWADTEMIKRGLKNINDTIKEFDKIGETITSMKGLAGINTGKNSKLQASVDAIRGITDILVGKNGGPSNRGEYSKGLPSFSRITTDSIKNLANAVDDIKRLIETLNTLATVGINQNITTKMQQISRTLDSVIRVFSGGTDTAGNVHYAFPKFSEERANSVKNLADGIANLHAIADNLNALATIGINQNVLIKLQLIKKAVRDVEMTFSTMFTKIQGPTNLSDNTNALAEGIRGLRRMVWHINNLASLEVNNSGLSAVVGQIRTALEELQTLSGILELDIEVKLATKFQKSVDDTIKEIKDAKEDIEATKNPKVDFSIPVNVSFSVTSNFSTALSGILRLKERLKNASGGSGGVHYSSPIGPTRPAKGGLIYRANGGVVGFPGRPIGTDRIPAWLSAGEYVHNKRAVDTFGIDFMRKVNNLDMKGAMNELMHRAGHMANINRGATITNNNYNNQKVVINNSNAGAGYTFKTASRFVGAF